MYPVAALYFSTLWFSPRRAHAYKFLQYLTTWLNVKHMWYTVGFVVWFTGSAGICIDSTCMLVRTNVIRLATYENAT
jgi:hypothetical protein